MDAASIHTASLRRQVNVRRPPGGACALSAALLRVTAIGCPTSILMESARLFVSQRDHGIDPCGTQRGNEPGNHGYRQERESAAWENRRFDRVDAVQQATQQRSQQERGGQTRRV